MSSNPTVTAVRVAMARTGARQKDVAAALDLSSAAVTRRFLGVVSFTADELHTIARSLGCQPADLIGSLEPQEVSA